MLGAVTIAPAVGGADVADASDGAETGRAAFTADPGPNPSGWGLFNGPPGGGTTPRSVEFFWGAVFADRRSTKAIEGGMAGVCRSPGGADRHPKGAAVGYHPAQLRAAAAAVRCPVLVIHGTDDEIVPVRRGEDLAALLGADLMLVEGGGRCPQAATRSWSTAR